MIKWIALFPKTYERVASILDENKAVYVEGKTNIREGNFSVLIDSITDKVPENTSKYDFVITVPKTASQSQLMELNGRHCFASLS